MALGGFGMILLLSRAGFGADRLEDFRGAQEQRNRAPAVKLLD